MNRDEKIAEEFLRIVHSNVAFEPDGNIPPDFSIDGNIGVEVRRLNQQHRNDGNIEGIEKQSIPLLKTVSNELSTYNIGNNGKSYWLTLRYTRNIDKNRIIKKNIKNSINAFENQNETIPFCYKLGKNVDLEFISNASHSKQKYKIGIESDMDSGGWVVPMYVDDITHCIKEKEQRIKPHLSKYGSWWLILVDNILCLCDSDITEVTQQLSKPACFSKIVILDINGQKLIEI